MEPGYGLVQEELVSPASMQYSLHSPLGVEPYWQEVSSLECAPIATTEEDTLMEMSDVQVWPAGVSPSLVTIEDSSLDGSSRADDSEGATLSLPCSLGRPSSGASGASGSIMELEEEEEEEGGGEVEEEEVPQEPASALAEWDRVRASGAVPKVNLNGQLGGQRSDARRGDGVAMGGGTKGGAGGAGLGLVEGISLVAGQRVYAQHGEPTELSQPPEHNGDNRMVGGGAFQPYLPDKDSLQGWVGSVSSGHDGSVPGLHAAQEALLTLVCDTSYSHVLRGHLLKGMQPFDKGRGFSHQETGQQPWEQEQRRGQVRLQCRPPAASCIWRGKTPSSR
ncbi:hypothetical protein CHARACLAT_025897 [Characodon lateralis]|uniref:Uncharacterized protein n=1 Tax=Characodon lateralis TaxID=208331 RepID=A0ABU7CRF2_9TELE|nr:hypothetical protein [Characodon lateralis]